MTVIEAIQTALTSVPGLTAQVPASRIRPFGSWRDVSLPAIMHRPIVVSGETRMHRTRETLREWATYQIDVFAESVSKCQELTDIIISGMPGKMPTGWTAWHDGGVTYLGYDEDVHAHHMALDFRVFGS